MLLKTIGWRGHAYAEKVEKDCSCLRYQSLDVSREEKWEIVDLSGG